MAKDVVMLTSATSANGQDLSIGKSGDSVMVDTAKVIKTDILCSNGVIHVIDTLMTSILEYIVVGNWCYKIMAWITQF